MRWAAEYISIPAARRYELLENLVSHTYSVCKQAHRVHLRVYTGSESRAALSDYCPGCSHEIERGSIKQLRRCARRAFFLRTCVHICLLFSRNSLLAE